MLGVVKVVLVHSKWQLVQVQDGSRCLLEWKVGGGLKRTEKKKLQSASIADIRVPPPTVEALRLGPHSIQTILLYSALPPSGRVSNYKKLLSLR